MIFISNYRHLKKEYQTRVRRVSVSDTSQTRTPTLVRHGHATFFFKCMCFLEEEKQEEETARKKTAYGQRNI